MVSESLVLTPVWRFIDFAPRSSGETSSPLSRASRSHARSDDTDEQLIRLADASLPFRWLTSVGQRVLIAWRESTVASRLARWRSAAVDRRIQLTALVMIVAILTHVAVTGFRAPEPTFAARATWIVILMALTVIATSSRGVDAAWTTWKSRRRERTTP